MHHPGRPVHPAVCGHALPISGASISTAAPAAGPGSAAAQGGMSRGHTLPLPPPPAAAGPRSVGATAVGAGAEAGSTRPAAAAGGEGGMRAWRERPGLGRHHRTSAPRCTMAAAPGVRLGEAAVPIPGLPTTQPAAHALAQVAQTAHRNPSLFSYCMLVAYDGTAYNGWQLQVRSVVCGIYVWVHGVACVRGKGEGGGAHKMRNLTRWLLDAPPPQLSQVHTPCSLPDLAGPRTNMCVCVTGMHVHDRTAGGLPDLCLLSCCTPTQTCSPRACSTCSLSPTSRPCSAA